MPCGDVDHPRSVSVGLGDVLEFRLGPIYTFGDTAIFDFGVLAKLPNQINSKSRQLELGSYFSKLMSPDLTKEDRT